MLKMESLDDQEMNAKQFLFNKTVNCMKFIVSELQKYSLVRTM